MRRRSYGGGKQGGLIKLETSEGGKETLGSPECIKLLTMEMKQMSSLIPLLTLVTSLELKW